MNRICEKNSLELDILCPESDSMKLVLGSLVKEIFETEYIPLYAKIIFHNIFSEARVHTCI